jgi:hypothetical protein
MDSRFDLAATGGVWHVHLGGRPQLGMKTWVLYPVTALAMGALLGMAIMWFQLR